jgi:hypothetical protein
VEGGGGGLVLGRGESGSGADKSSDDGRLHVDIVFLIYYGMGGIR